MCACRYDTCRYEYRCTKPHLTVSPLRIRIQGSALKDALTLEGARSLRFVVFRTSCGEGTFGRISGRNPQAPKLTKSYSCDGLEDFPATNLQVMAPVRAQTLPFCRSCLRLPTPQYRYFSSTHPARRNGNYPNPNPSLSLMKSLLNNTQFSPIISETNLFSNPLHVFS